MDVLLRVLIGLAGGATVAGLMPGIVRRRRQSTNRLAPHRSCGVLRATGLF